ncbi:MAG: DUF2147 domain-containing protein [Devosia sp.]
MTVLKAISVVAVVTLFGGEALAATIHSPAGTWVTNGGESKYELTLCGDGDDLCAKMIWVNDTELGQKLRPYLGEAMLVTAPRVATQKWRGQITLQGRTVKGSIEILDANNIHVRGCEGALCQGVELIRVAN